MICLLYRDDAYALISITVPVYRLSNLTLLEVMVAVINSTFDCFLWTGHTATFYSAAIFIIIINIIIIIHIKFIADVLT